jgi:hypothetical protein
MQWRLTLFVLAAAGVAAVQAGTAAAQQAPARKPAQGQQVKEYFDMYEPVQRLRMRSESCSRKETPVGAYCAKACKTGYSMVPGSNPPRCRSLTPLPAGQFPGPVRKEMDTVQPHPTYKPAKPAKPIPGN